MVLDMRWDNLRLDEPLETGDGEDLFTAGRRDRALPLIERGAVARTFDTPGFRGMTFYEVQAKSVVNRVPEASRMPFRWTINPYRGCQHACTYCAVGETPILMADGRTKPLAQVRAGDEHLRHGPAWLATADTSVTTVLAHWSTVKPAYRVMLADGTQLVCSGDHRFLTERGWKYVTGAGSAGCGAPAPDRQSHADGHRRLRRAAEADRRLPARLPMRPDPRGRRHRPLLLSAGHPAADRSYLFRLALTEPAARRLARTADYLARAGIGCRDFTLPRSRAHGAGSWQPSTRRRVTAIRTAAADQARTLEWLHRAGRTIQARIGARASWPGSSTREGSYRGWGPADLPDADPEIINWRLLAAIARLRCRRGAGAPAQRYPRRGPVGRRARPGAEVLPRRRPREHRPERSIEDVAVKTDDGLRVAAVEPLGLDVPMYDITTGTGDFIANGVVSHNCFARNSHTYLDLDAGADFNTRVVVKVNAPELVRKKMASPSWAGEHIAMGTNVDCYQRAEGRYQLMPGIIGALRDAANPFSILTKGTLILRDIELLAEAAEVTEVGLNVSAGFVDKDLWRSIEPGTPAPGRRLEACATLNERGLRCGVLMGPVVPFLSDSPAQLDEAVRQIAAAGAGHVMPIVLHLRPGTREWFFSWLRAQHPGLVEAYLDLYGRGAYAPKAYQNRIAGQVRELAEKYGIGRPRPGFGHGTLRPRSATASRPAAAEHPAAMPSPRARNASESLKSPEVPAPRRRSPAPPEQLTLL